MADLAAEVAAPRFRVAGGRVECLDDLRDLDLNAVAKGFVVDRVVAAMVATFDLVALTVNAGGDLVHVGSDLVVAIEDPHNPFDNAPPLCRVRVRDRAIATSGSARRWFDVGGEHVNRVLDPRTGWPVEDVASVSVVARDAATADVVATVLSVLAADEVDPFVEPLEVAYLRVATDGTVRSNEAWRSMEVRR
jgi:thiamine biosynthesis lipoprotein